LPDLGDLGEGALVRRDARPSLVQLPVEVVEEDPPAGAKQAIDKRERQRIHIPSVRAIDEDEVVSRLGPPARELVPEGVVQEPRVARLLEDHFDSGTEAGLLDRISCRRPATLSVPS